MPWRRSGPGSVVCPSCGTLVGASVPRCPNCGRPYPGMFGLAPLLRRLGADLGLAEIVVGLCALLFLASLAVDPGGIGFRSIFTFLSPSPRSLDLFGISGYVPVFRQGRWWTVASAPWLHGGLLHIAFNMLWIRQLAPAVSSGYGFGRAAVIYAVSGVTGFVLSSVAPMLPVLPLILGGGGYTLGASAPLFGLLGALVWYSRRAGSRALGQQIWTWAIFLFVFGLIVPGIDNWAHLGGFLGGLLTGRWLDPLTPERGDHLLAGIVGLLLGPLAIAASVLHRLL